jgi:hypothetical protein
MPMLNRQTLNPVFQEVSITALTPGLLEKFTRLWYACPTDLPDLGKTYSAREQGRLEGQAARLLDGLVFEIKHLPRDPKDRQAIQERIQSVVFAFAKTSLGVEDRHLELVKKYHFVEIAREFAQKAREFDASIDSEDIYQASRNVLTMNFLQLILDLPVELTPAVFAYSMLYPYTDNYLDDPSISPNAKKLFNDHLRLRLVGEDMVPMNHSEQAIFDLVKMIENQFDRSHYPQVYENLLAIHLAQTRSLRLHRGLHLGATSPYEVDVLGLSFEKGGMAVVADGCLVAGSLLPIQAEFMYGYGVFTQLIDDLEDLARDRQDGILTLFTHTSRAWKLDAITNQLFNLGTQVFTLMEPFASPVSLEFKELIARCINPLLIDSATQSPAFYNRPYLKNIETHLPFRPAFLAKQRRKLEHQKLSAIKLFDGLI